MSGGSADRLTVVPRKREPAAVERVEVRATVALSGVAAGGRILVDPTDPWVERAIKDGYMVPIDGAEPETAAAPEPEPGPGPGPGPEPEPEPEPEPVVAPEATEEDAEAEVEDAGSS